MGAKVRVKPAKHHPDEYDGLVGTITGIFPTGVVKLFPSPPTELLIDNKVWFRASRCEVVE
jgi:hypothetical protein